MKIFILSALAALTQAHSIFQKLSVNGIEQAQLVGLRAPSQPNPITNVNDAQLSCGIRGTQSSQIITVKSGDKLGAWWGHVIGGAQRPNDPDHPIASSHKGPISTYMAQVSSAATSPSTNLKWFKIAEDGFNPQTGKWGVDNMIANKGWSYATIPACLAPGQYLLRQELLALHSAYGNMGAQFYTSCAQLNVTGEGRFVPAETVSIPGAYKQNDPGVLIQIWVNSVPDNGRKAYAAPGPRVVSCPV